MEKAEVPEEITQELESQHSVDYSKNLADVSGKEEIEYIVTANADWSRSNLSLFQSLKGIVTTGTAIDYIDDEYCSENNISIRNTAGYTGPAVAEHAIALMLAQAKYLVASQGVARDGGSFDDLPTSVELHGKTIGIVGFGDVGSRIAKLASAFGMKVIYYNRSKKDSEIGIQCSKEQLFQQSHVIIFSVPLDETTHSFINQENLPSLKGNTILVNISADELIEREALIRGIDNGKIAGAGLDVIGSTKDYSGIANTTLTPMRAWYTPECIARRNATWFGELKGLISKP